MAIHQIQEMLPVAGIDIVGPLPGYLQETLVFEAASVGDTKRNAASESLINFLQTPTATKVIRAKGMEPASK